MLGHSLTEHDVLMDRRKRMPILRIDGSADLRGGPLALSLNLGPLGMGTNSVEDDAPRQ